MKKKLLLNFTESLFRKRNFGITAFAVLTLLTVQSSFAQKWNVIGDGTNISTTAIYYTSITVVGTVPYLAYTDGSASGGTSHVKQRNADGSWTQVGTNNPFDATAVQNIRIFSDKNGKLYVGAVDKTGGLLSVATLDTNNTWIRTNVSSNSANYTGPSETRFDMAFDSNNVPYIAYSERISTTSGYPWVKSFDGASWVTVGTGAVQTTDAYAAAVDIALDATNVPYLVYINQVYNLTTPSPLKVFRFVGGTWGDITPPSNAVGTTLNTAIRYSNITMDSDNNPVVCYFNFSNSSKSTIIRYNKTAIPAVWDSPLVNSSRDANNLSLIIDTAGNLYNMFSDTMIGSSLGNTVRVFKKASGATTFTELQNIPITSPSGAGIDATGPNDNTARNTKIANLSIAVGSDTSKPYIVYTKSSEASGTLTLPIVRLFDPLILTTATTAITSTSATLGGELLASAPAVGTIIERGIVYDTTVSPTTAVTTKVVDGALTAGVFSSSITGLTASTNYYTRAYFIYSDGTTTFTVYGDNKKFTTAASLSTDSFEKLDLVKAYPNPTNDFVTVNLPNNSVVEKIAVYNSLGQLMFTEAKNTVSLQNLANGNYYLTIYASDGNYAKKIIKQ